MLTRRYFLAAASALPAASALRPVWAASTLEIGAARIDMLSDGHLTLPGDMLFGPMPQADLKTILKSHGLPADRVSPPCNVTLLRSGKNAVLFDVGSGHDFQETAGKLPAALEALGLAPEDITHICMTHAHPDHIWGLLDEFDEPLFPNAQFIIGKAEFDFWMSPDAIKAVGEERATFAVGAARRLKAVAESARLLKDGEEALPGVAAHLTPGHTPGHMAYEIRIDKTSVMVLGDALSNHHVAFEKPEWPYGSDQDQATAAKTRVKLLDRLAAEKMVFSGFHLPDGGLGRAEKKDSAWRFIAA